MFFRNGEHKQVWCKDDFYSAVFCRTVLGTSILPNTCSSKNTLYHSLCILHLKMITKCITIDKPGRSHLTATPC